MSVRVHVFAEVSQRVRALSQPTVGVMSDVLGAISRPAESELEVSTCLIDR